MEFTTWLTFFAAAWAISISPGAGAVAAMSAGLTHGFRRGYLTTLGLVLGIWTQLVVVGVGLGVLIATSSVAFAVVKWCGVAYLVWLGVQQWRAPDAPLAAAGGGGAAASRRALVLRGWTVNALNPKGTIFLLAVVPQFIDSAAPLATQYLAIGATFGLVECAVMSGYVALAARVLALLRSPRWHHLINQLPGYTDDHGGTVAAMTRLLPWWR